MPKVKCDMDECVHNKKGMCQKEEITLVYEMYENMWCNDFEDKNDGK